MRRDPEAAEPVDVLDNRVRGAAERVRGPRHVERDVVPLVGADLHRVQDEHAIDVLGRVGRPRRVTVVRQDDEPHSRPRGRGRNSGPIANPVRAGGVDVIRAGNRSRRQIAPPAAVEPFGRRRRHEPYQTYAGQGQRQDCRSQIEDWRFTDSRLMNADWNFHSRRPTSLPNRQSSIVNRQSV